MSNAPYQDLITLADAYGRHLNLSHWRVSYLVRGDGQFFRRLTDGKGCTVKTAVAALGWFADHWPSDLAWPSDIPRPPRSKKEAA